MADTGDAKRDRETIWKGKLNGRFFKAINELHVDEKASDWLRFGDLFGKTEGFRQILRSAIKHQVIKTSEGQQ